jgi:hypothetical protein
VFDGDGGLLTKDSRRDVEAFVTSLGLDFFLFKPEVVPPGWDASDWGMGFVGRGGCIKAGEHEIALWKALETSTYETAMAGMCVHCIDYKGETCILCFGDGTEEISECLNCHPEGNVSTWHRGGKCFKCQTPPPPYAELRNQIALKDAEIAGIGSMLLELQQENSAQRSTMSEAKKVKGAEHLSVHGALNRLDGLNSYVKATRERSDEVRDELERIHD